MQARNSFAGSFGRLEHSLSTFPNILEHPITASPDGQDLTCLLHPTNNTVTDLLQQRFESGHSYTRIGPSILVIINPHHFKPNDIEESIRSIYVDDVIDSLFGQNIDIHSLLNSHIYEITGAAFIHLFHDHEDQVLLLW